MSPAFVERAMRYRLLDAEAAIRRRTSFFSAAASICDAFSCVPPTPFLADLSAQLEDFNVDRAKEIRVGLLYPQTDVRQNTADFIAAEQAIVEWHLLDLRRRDRYAYQAELKSANQALRICSLWQCLPFLLPGWRTVSRAVGDVHRILGRLPRFEERTDRELIGRRLACPAS